MRRNRFFEAAELSQELIDQTRMIGKLSHLAEELRMTLRFIRKTAHDKKK
jgi:hypothetical protein